MTEYLTVAEVAGILHCSPSFIRRECLAGRLPYVQLAPPNLQPACLYCNKSKGAKV
jgi:hypothetical protein